jgi:hypothetical protein
MSGSLPNPEEQKVLLLLEKCHTPPPVEELMSKLVYEFRQDDAAQRTHRHNLLGLVVGKRRPKPYFVQ